MNFDSNIQQIDQGKGSGKSEHSKNESASKEENEARKKKRARVWTPELHQRFTEAISELGGKRSKFFLMAC